MERSELNDLLAFATVARERSFTRAAAKLGVSPSALSHAMRSLEARLDVRLLARTTRSVAPTEAGMRLLETVSPALASIEEGLESLAHWRDSISGTVRVTASTYAAQTVLMQKLPGFLLAHPEVKVEINIEDRFTDIVAEGFDAGIRFHMSVDKDMIAIPVGPALKTTIVGTPDYFERYPPPKTPVDLQNHVCAGFRLRSGAVLAWDLEEDGREFRFRPTGQLIANDGPLITAAVRAGAALGYMIEDDVASEIADGRLIQVLDQWCTPFPGLHLYHPSRRQSPPALRALITALREPPGSSVR